MTAGYSHVVYTLCTGFPELDFHAASRQFTGVRYIRVDRVMNPLKQPPVTYEPEIPGILGIDSKRFMFQI